MVKAKRLQENKCRNRIYSYSKQEDLYYCKKGDVNGDANINSGDLLKLQKHLLKDTNIVGTPYGNAADSNNDGKLNSGDLLKIQNFY